MILQNRDLGRLNTSEQRPPVESFVSTRCARCTSHHGPVEWRRLELLERLTRENCASIVTTWPWPSDVILEARRCTCGESLVRCCPNSV